MATVLCIDDNPDSLNMRKCILGKQGYSVLTADNGTDALRALADNPVDLVVLDYRMPDMDGLAVARAICQRDESTRIVLLIGCPKQEVPEELVRIVDAFVSKGQDPAVLLGNLQRLTDLAQETLAWEVISSTVRQSKNETYAPFSAAHHPLTH